MGLNLHGDVRLKNLIRILRHVGIPMSYNMVRETKLGLARAVLTLQKMELCCLWICSMMYSALMEKFWTHWWSNLASNDYYGTCITLTKYLSDNNMVRFVLQWSSTDQISLNQNFRIITTSFHQWIWVMRILSSHNWWGKCKAYSSLITDTEEIRCGAIMCM